MTVYESTHRIATESDIEQIKEIMRASIAENMKSFLTKEEIIAAQETMGLEWDRLAVARSWREGGTGGGIYNH